MPIGLACYNAEGLCRVGMDNNGQRHLTKGLDMASYFEERVIISPLGIGNIRQEPDGSIRIFFSDGEEVTHEVRMNKKCADEFRNMVKQNAQIKSMGLAGLWPDVK